MEMQFPPGTRTVPWLPGLGLAGVHPCKNLGLLWLGANVGPEPRFSGSVRGMRDTDRPP